MPYAPSDGAMSPTSTHVPRLSFGQTSAAPVSPTSQARPLPFPTSAGPPTLHRPSLSKFTFPSRNSEPFLVRDNMPSPYEQAPARPSSVGPGRGAAELEYGVGLDAEPVPRTSTTGDLAQSHGSPDIQFRSPFQQPRPSVRTLYSGATIQTSRFVSDPAYAGNDAAAYGARKQSLVRPEEYMPGLPAGSNTGKAANAGFDPAESDVSARIREARTSMALQRKPSLAASHASFKSAKSSPDNFRPLSAMSGHHDDTTDADIGDIGRFSETHGQDDSPPSTPRGSDSTAMPTMYENSYMGPISFQSPMVGKDSAHFSRRSSVVPRDPLTGNIDWRARLQMKPTPRGSISLESGDKSIIFDSSSKSSSPINEKFGGVHYANGKPTPVIIDIDNERYTALGRMLLRMSPLTFVLAEASTGFYLFLRARSIIRANNLTGNWFITAWLFYAFEAVFALFIGVRALYKLCNLSFSGKPRYLLQGDFALPNVDVLVLATGQDPSMVLDAVIAAARLDWPVDKLRVLLIDETRSDTIRHLVEQYSNTRAIHVTYHARNPNAKVPRGGVWPKSSTINFGLAETRAEGRIAGQYSVILEAESLAEPGMLRALLPHMIENPLLALVQSPSAFYNLPKKLSSAFSTFISCVEPVQDSRSGFAVRRSAIDDIGGFPTRSSVEDRRLEMLLKGKGYSTLFLDEALQYSMAPDSFSKHLRQRVDRTLAHFKTYLRLGFYLFSFQLSELSFGQRLLGVGRGLAPFLSIIIALTSVALPIAFAFGGFLIPALSIGEINTMVWAALAMIVTEKLHDFCFAMPSGEASTRRFVRSQVFMAPYLVLGMVRSLIPNFLCRAPETYWVAKEPGTKTERNPKARASLGKRLLAVTLGSHGWTHLLMICAILGTIGYSLYNSTVAFAHGQRGLHQTALYILMTVAWPTLPWMDLLLGSLTPFIYAIHPPSIPNREVLLTREPISSRANPQEQWKSVRSFKTSFWGQTILSALVVVYAAAVFSLTFTDLHVD